MKSGFFLKLAWESLKRNRRTVIPYLLTCQLCVAIFYLMGALTANPAIQSMRGGSTTTLVLELGSIVIGVFSVIFLFYTHSFLIRQRKKEFGLYHVLGMDKHAISRVLMWETLLMASASIIAGLAAGIVVSKLGELILVRMNNEAVVNTFFVDGASIRNAVILYGIIFLLLLLNGIRQIRFTSTTELLRSEHQGEKPPKANFVTAALGVILLGVAYYMAVSIQKPLTAMLMFFVAVILVIIGTYLLMISGSVALCRMLQKNKRYYYQSRHFVSVSSLVYRMKRNGAGLASICVLSTMVLVMLSSTACLNFGSRDSLDAMYPRDVCLSVGYSDVEKAFESADLIQSKIDQKAEAMGLAPFNKQNEMSISVYGYFSGDELFWDSAAEDVNVAMAVSQVVCVTFMDAEAVAPQLVSRLGDHQVAVFSENDSFRKDHIIINGESFDVVVRLDQEPGTRTFGYETVPCLIVLTNDFVQTASRLLQLRNSSGYAAAELVWNCGFDTSADLDTQWQFINETHDELQELFAENHVIYYVTNSREDAISEFFALYSGFFFLGVLLSIVFLIAAALIIYYKQLSEGYEDQGRFEILQKVGMSRKDIRRSINSQMLTVFFFPLGLSVIHLVFAFPMVSKLLSILGVTNTPFLMMTAAISALGFALFYLLVYKGTSGVYYRLVSEGTRD